MNNFLETLDRVQSENTGLVNLFSEKGMTSISGKKSYKNTPNYKKSVAEAAKLIANVMNGKTPSRILAEVMTTDDFPFLFGDILDRSVLAAYQEWPTIWTATAKKSTVTDFRDAKIFPPTWGADGVLDIVPQASPYPATAIYEQEPILWHVTKYGRTVPFSWESIINDDLDMLKDIPERLGRAARRTENDLVTRLYVGTTGPHASMYTSGFQNIINTANGAATNNPPLGIVGLQDAFTVLSKMTDESGQPIMRDMVTLVVPPALEVTARNILNATQINATQLRAGGSPDASSSGYQELQIDNWMKNRLQLVVDPYIPMIATTNGNTSWFLFSDPNTSREAIRIGFLRGHESPEIWMQSPNAVRVGGGAVNVMDGDFETDAIVYRVRHVTGVARIDGKATVASNGTGS